MKRYLGILLFASSCFGQFVAGSAAGGGSLPVVRPAPPSPPPVVKPAPAPVVKTAPIAKPTPAPAHVTTAPSSSVVTFNKGGSVSTHIVPETGRPPQVVDFNRSPDPSALANSLIDSMNQIEIQNAQSQAMAQSLTSALDNQVNASGGASATVPPVYSFPQSSGFTPSPGNAAVPGAPGDPQTPSSPDAGQQLAGQLLDKAAGMLPSTPDPLEAGAEDTFGSRVGSAVVDKFIDELNHAGVDPKRLQDPDEQARFQVDTSTNPLNLRKGLYDYSNGMIKSMTDTLNRFVPPPPQQ